MGILALSPTGFGKLNLWIAACQARIEKPAPKGLGQDLEWGVYEQQHICPLQEVRFWKMKLNLWLETTNDRGEKAGVVNFIYINQEGMDQEIQASGCFIG